MRLDAETTKTAASGSRVRASGLFIATLVVGNPFRRCLEESAPSRGRPAQGLDTGRGRTANLFDGQGLGAGRFFSRRFSRSRAQNR
jgi:hypothetical protein